MAKRKYFIFKQVEGNGLRVDFRSWAFVIVIGLLLALISIIDRGGVAAVGSAVGGVTCGFTVNGDTVNVHTEATASSPSVQQLAKGQAVTGTTTVTNGYRQLENGTWVLESYLTPVPGNTCG
jgi:uncharacterized protein YgiM (DUF1202 family)